VLGFLRRSVDELGQTIVMVTHDPVAAAYADRVLYLADGRVVDDMYSPTADLVLDRMRRFDAHGHAHAHGHAPAPAPAQQRRA
jgi:putative ABC transport system ATP-binding protein